jgi:hypothetical protein
MTKIISFLLVLAVNGRYSKLKRATVMKFLTREAYRSKIQSPETIVSLINRSWF